MTICNEFLKRILESLPNEVNPDGVTPADAAVGQFFWVTLHEVGHATFGILGVPIFGHEAADNFATYIMLQFGEGQAHRLIAGAAWAWRAYLGDYKKNPVVPLRLSAFGSDHDLPQERFYNLVCLAFGADRVGFADLANYLPPTRISSKRWLSSQDQRVKPQYSRAIDCGRPNWHRHNDKRREPRRETGHDTQISHAPLYRQLPGNIAVLLQ